jgi:hypothetical protein
MRPDAGVMIFEVKDWNLGSYDINDKKHWFVTQDHKKWSRIKSPIDQVLGYKQNLYDLHIENSNPWGVVSCAIYFHCENYDKVDNFLTGKFNKLVDSLDVNKKLDALFGPDAKKIRAIAAVGKNVEARPKGSFVNESNTAVAAAQMAKQYGTELLKRIPGVGAVVEPAQQIMEQRRTAKETKKTLRPAAGVRLSDIGKK